MVSRLEAAKAATRSRSTGTDAGRSILRIEAHLFAQQQAELLLAGQPFIVQGMLGEALTSQHILTQLEQVLGNRLLCIRTGAYDNPLTYATNRQEELMTLTDYVNRYFGRGATELIPYAANNKLTWADSESLHIHPPILPPATRNSWADPSLWLGAQGSSTPLHRDSSDNFCCHIFGRKRWVLYSILDEQNLYFTANPYGQLANPLSEFASSAVDLRHPDFTAFPLLRSAQPLVAEIAAGDALYLPYGWGHYAENITDSIMVNFWCELADYEPFVLGHQK